MRREELTSEERRALDALPRNRKPRRELENRTVHALEERGLLGGAPRRGFILTPAGAAWAVAAVALLVVVSFAAGQRTGIRRQVISMHKPPEGNGIELATFVQRAGSTYVAALEELNRTASRQVSPEIEQGREAAVATLYAASDQIVRLVPEEPVVRSILTTLEETDRIRVEADAPEGARVLWF